jgi:lipopolysaccharide/colanic/teichoic acid biosynthesis glycosyltransferase
MGHEATRLQPSPTGPVEGLQIINMFEGNMKLVGIRPLSKQYFELYDEEVRERRLKYKPGLVPPYYADMPTDLEGIQASEMKYLDSYDKHPLLTDARYFIKSWWNIDGWLLAPSP